LFWVAQRIRRINLLFAHQKRQRANLGSRTAMPSAVDHAEAAMVVPAISPEQLAEVRGTMRKAGYPDKFINENFGSRDRAMYPHDVLVVYVPSTSRKSSTGRRVVGALRRSLMPGDDGKDFVWINYIWVIPEFRRQQLGKLLILRALWYGETARDVRLWPTDDNEDGSWLTSLYSKLGFVRDEDEDEMIFEAHRLPPAPSSGTWALTSGKTWSIAPPKKNLPKHLPGRWGLMAPGQDKCRYRAPRATC
jgi:GNAT superfamily N-acetyltransferase